MQQLEKRTCLILIAMGLSALVAVAEEPQSAVGPLMKLFQSGRLPAERQGTVVEMICNRGNEHDLKIIFDRVVQPEGFAPPLRLQAMGWLADAAKTRKVKPAGDLSALESLVTKTSNSKDFALQIAAIKLAATWNVASIAPALQSLATNSKGNPEIQHAAMNGLIAIGGSESRKTLEVLTAKDNRLQVRMLAAAGLASLDLRMAAAAAAEVLTDATPQDDSDALLDSFLNRKQGAEELAAALAKQSLKPDVAKRALRYMYSVGRSDAALSDVLSRAAGIAADAPPPTPAEVAQIVTDVATNGNAERGEMVFRRKDLNCMKCHSVSRAGGQVGPELSAVGGSSPLDYVVNSILNPNLAIKEQYVTRVFVLANGQVLTGVVIDRDETRINMRDANGQAVTIPTADVEEELEGKSLMPQGLTKFLTRDELLDLAKFISELGKPGPYSVQQAKTVQRWRILQNPPPELIDDVPHLEHFRQFVLGSAPEAWQPAYGKVNGFLPLDELRVGSAPTVVILQGYFEIKSAGLVEVQINSTEKVQTWVNTDSFESRNSFEISPAVGRHTITLRVEISDRDRPELKVEFLVPEKSTAIIEVVGGQ